MRLTSILAIFGEFSGNFRSTPSPCTMRRTVNISRLPEPLRAITTPLKIWMRSFSPSRIRVCTSTVSPMANSGTSVLRLRLFHQLENGLAHGINLLCRVVILIGWRSIILQLFDAAQGDGLIEFAAVVRVRLCGLPTPHSLPQISRILETFARDAGRVGDLPEQELTLRIWRVFRFFLTVFAPAATLPGAANRRPLAG